MKLLLDTHILLWAAMDELPQAAAPYINCMSNELFFSPASIWEVAIKNGLGRSDFIIDPGLLYSGLSDAGYKEMHITGRHALYTSSLPPLHKDPFDRILLAQAAYEGIPLLTADKVVAGYPCPVILLGQ